MGYVSGMVESISSQLPCFASPKDGSTGAAGRFYFKVSAVNGVGTGEGVWKSQDVPGRIGFEQCQGDFWG